jgi:hypothetical protein
VKRRRDRPDLDVEDIGDRAVVEVEVVPEIKGVALPRWKPLNCLSHDRRASVGFDDRIGGDIFRLRWRSADSAIQVVSGVDHASGYPRFERSCPLERCPASDGVCESLLYRVSGPLGITCLREREPKEVRGATIFVAGFTRIVRS